MNARSYPSDWRDDERLPRYTDSVDAALALAEKVLPDHFMTLKTKTGGAFHHCEIEGEDDGEWKAVNMSSLALAIVLATLLALQPGPGP